MYVYPQVIEHKRNNYIILYTITTSLSHIHTHTHTNVFIYIYKIKQSKRIESMGRLIGQLFADGRINSILLRIPDGTTCLQKTC